MNKSEGVNFGFVDDRPEKEKFLSAKTLANYMDVELLVHPKGPVFLVHHKPMPVIFDWVEYDPSYDQMTFASHKGELMYLGVEVPVEMHEYLQKAPAILLMHEENGEMQDSYPLPLLYQEVVWN